MWRERSTMNRRENHRDRGGQEGRIDPLAWWPNLKLILVVPILSSRLDALCENYQDPSRCLSPKQQVETHACKIGQ